MFYDRTVDRNVHQPVQPKRPVALESACNRTLTKLLDKLIYFKLLISLENKSSEKYFKRSLGPESRAIVPIFHGVNCKKLIGEFIVLKKIREVLEGWKS